jgi:DNA polymerase subunit delta-2
VHDTLHLCTNPTWFSVHGRRILATSGQNIHDLLKYLPDEAQSTDAALNMAASTLEWSHIAPTAPDTLWCYPFKATDALVIRAAPDLYLIGNQDAYATKLVHNVRLILVPSFARTHEVVVLDTETLEPHVMSFHT